MTLLLDRLDDIPDIVRGCALTIGNFDGVHKGHAELLRTLSSSAKAKSVQAVVLTFNPPPAAVLYPERPRSAPITPTSRKKELLRLQGIDTVIELHASPELLSQSPDDFFEGTVVSALQATAMVEGPNFHFGKDRAGNVELLSTLCDRQGIELQIAEPQQSGPALISSTRIRQLISDGMIAQANEMLTQDFQICGRVAHGAGRGRQLGFATANLEQIQSIIPGHGVYAATVFDSGRLLPAAVSIGPNPTFDEVNSKVEVHVIGLDRDLYGSQLTCRFITKIRDMQKFESIEELKSRVGQDIAQCRELANGNSRH